MLKIREAIVVEGRYDKNTLSQVVDAPIFQTNGFGIRNDKELVSLLRHVARKRGLIVFTDSDSGGLLIRNFLKSAIDASYLKHAYIPEVFGKERRKSAPGKEGKLGVEGMTPEVIVDCLRRAGATVEGEGEVSSYGNITKLDFFYMGLSGSPNSKHKREQLLQTLGFPTNLSANAMLQALNLLYTKDQIYRIVDMML